MQNYLKTSQLEETKYLKSTDLIHVSQDIGYITDVIIDKNFDLGISDTVLKDDPVIIQEPAWLHLNDGKSNVSILDGTVSLVRDGNETNDIILNELTFDVPSDATEIHTILLSDNRFVMCYKKIDKYYLKVCIINNNVIEFKDEFIIDTVGANMSNINLTKLTTNKFVINYTESNKGYTIPVNIYNLYYLKIGSPVEHDIQYLAVPTLSCKNVSDTDWLMVYPLSEETVIKPAEEVESTEEVINTEVILKEGVEHIQKITNIINNILYTANNDDNANIPTEEDFRYIGITLTGDMYESLINNISESVSGDVDTLSEIQTLVTNTYADFSASQDLLSNEDDLNEDDFDNLGIGGVNSDNINVINSVIHHVKVIEDEPEPEIVSTYYIKLCKLRWDTIITYGESQVIYAMSSMPKLVEIKASNFISTFQNIDNSIQLSFINILNEKISNSEIIELNIIAEEYEVAKLDEKHICILFKNTNTAKIALYNIENSTATQLDLQDISESVEQIKLIQVGNKKCVITYTDTSFVEKSLSVILHDIVLTLGKETEIDSNILSIDGFQYNTNKLIILNNDNTFKLIDLMGGKPTGIRFNNVGEHPAYINMRNSKVYKIEISFNYNSNDNGVVFDAMENIKFNFKGLNILSADDQSCDFKQHIQNTDDNVLPDSGFITYTYLCESVIDTTDISFEITNEKRGLFEISNPSVLVYYTIPGKPNYKSHKMTLEQIRDYKLPNFVKTRILNKDKVIVKSALYNKGKISDTIAEYLELATGIIDIGIDSTCRNDMGISLGDNSVIEGYHNSIHGEYNHSEGSENCTVGEFNQVEGHYNDINIQNKEDFGNYNLVTGDHNTVESNFSEVFGSANLVYTLNSNITGSENTINSSHNIIVSGSKNVVDNISKNIMIYGDENKIGNCKNTIIIGHNIQSNINKISNSLIFSTDTGVSCENSFIVGYNSIIYGNNSYSNVKNSNIILKNSIAFGNNISGNFMNSKIINK